MDKGQAMDVLETIASAYPKFDLHDKRIEVWTERLSEMDYGHVLFNLKKYISTEKWPPTIADIAAYPRRKDPALEKIEKMEQRARENSDPEKSRKYLEEAKRRIRDA